MLYNDLLSGAPARNSARSVLTFSRTTPVVLSPRTTADLTPCYRLPASGSILSGLSPVAGACPPAERERIQRLPTMNKAVKTGDGLLNVHKFIHSSIWPRGCASHFHRRDRFVPAR